MSRFAAALAALLITLPAIVATPAAAQQAEIPNPPPLWTHAASGTPFPDKVSGFERVSVTQYGDNDRMTSAGYSLWRDGGHATVTLYVFPARGADCAREFSDAQQALQNANPGAKLMQDGRAPSPAGTTSSAARLVRYTIPEDGTTVTSDLYLYCTEGDRWFVKYRATYPASMEADVVGLVRAIRWPAALSR